MCRQLLFIHRSWCNYLVLLTSKRASATCTQPCDLVADRQSRQPQVQLGAQLEIYISGKELMCSTALLEKLDI